MLTAQTCPTDQGNHDDDIEQIFQPVKLDFRLFNLYFRSMSQYFAGSTNANLTQAGLGRKRGSYNKTHAVVRWGLTEAYRQLGGVDGLVKWGKTHRTEFYQLLGKLIPAEIADQHGANGGRIQVVILPANSENTVSKSILEIPAPAPTTTGSGSDVIIDDVQK